MSETYEKSKPANSGVTSSATSSPESEDGRSPSDLPDGPTIEKSGLAVARARLSPSQERKRSAQRVAEVLSHALDELVTSFASSASTRGMLMSGTYGRNSGGSSPTASLQSCLESRLRARMDGYGSPEFEASLEILGYAVGSADLAAAGVTAPHIRQRLFWLADANCTLLRPVAPARQQSQSEQNAGDPDQRLAHASGGGLGTNGRTSGRGRHADKRGALVRLANPECGSTERHGYEISDTPGEVQGKTREQRLRPDAGDGGTVSGLEHAVEQRLEGHTGHGDDGRQPGRNGAVSDGPTAETSGAGGMGNPDSEGPFSGAHAGVCGGEESARPRDVQPERSSSLHPAWSDFTIIYSEEQPGVVKARRIKSGLEPMATGVSERVGLLRGAGDAICPQVACEFIQAYEESVRSLGL